MGKVTEEDISYDVLDSKYILYFSFEEENNQFGITYFDLNILEFWVGQFTDDTMKSKFRTLITRIRPVEVVCDSKLKQSEMIKMLRNSPVKPSCFFIPSADILDFRDSQIIIEHYLSTEATKLPKLIYQINENEPSVISLGNAIKYLESLQCAEKTVALGTFYIYTHEGMSDGTNLVKRPTMVLDAQILENLEIFEVQSKQATTTEGSLFSFINRWTTKFGQRLLKKWLCSPLFDINKIRARHEVVEELVKNTKLLKSFKSEMKEVYDLEKYLARIYRYSVETESRALYVSINMISRLNDFYILLSQFESLIKKLDKVFGNREKIKSMRLRTLLTYKQEDVSGTQKSNKENISKKGNKKKKTEKKPEKKRFTIDSDDDEDVQPQNDEEEMEVDDGSKDVQGILPDISDLLDQFSKIIVWKSVGNKKVPEPVKGISKDYDLANQRIEDLKKGLQKCLEDTKEELGIKDVKYDTGSKVYRFQFDVPNSKAEKVPEDYINTSNSKTTKRYQNQKLKDLVRSLEEAEENLK